MPEKPLELHPGAEEDYRAAYAWYRERSLPAAEKFESAVERALDYIEESPERWPVYQSRFRKYTLLEFPYKIIYFSDSSRTFVLAIAHGSRKPGYWKKRRRLRPAKILNGGGGRPPFRKHRERMGHPATTLSAARFNVWFVSRNAPISPKA